MERDADNTWWSMLIHARSPEAGTYEQAWDYLFRTYRPVILSYFRSHARDSVAAEDWTDDFIAGWVRGRLDGADREKGKFRHYLFGALRKFRYEKYRAASAKSRKHMSADWLEDDVEDPGAATEAQEAFERDFANHVISIALEKLEQYQASRQSMGASHHSYDLLYAYHIRPLGPDPRPSYEELGEKFGMTEKAVEYQLKRARTKLRDWILAQLRQVVGSEEELPEELALLFKHSPHLELPESESSS